MKYRSVTHFLERALPEGCEISGWTAGERGFYILLVMGEVPAILSYEQMSQEWCYVLRIFGRASLNTKLGDWRTLIIYSRGGLRGSYGDPSVRPTGAMNIPTVVEVLHLMERYRKGVWSKRRAPKSTSLWMKAITDVCYTSVAAMNEADRISQEGMTSLVLTVVEAFNCLRGSFSEIDNNVLLITSHPHRWWLLNILSIDIVKKLLVNADVVQVE